MDNQPNPAQENPTPEQQSQPTQQPIAQPQQKNSNLTVLIIVLIIIFVGLPLLFFYFLIVFAGNIFTAGVDLANEFANEIDHTTSENYVAGDWSCLPYSDAASNTSDKNYTTTLQLNKDMTFSYGQYGDLSNNHFAGTYTYEAEEREANNAHYYMINFDTTEMLIGGEKQDTSSDNHKLSQMEMGILKNAPVAEKQAITIFTSNYSMYYCYAKK